MSITATFGAGGSEPYARALRDSDVLYLRSTDGRGEPMDVGRWSARADLTDLTLLSSVTGPMLDIGCGPARMVRAARELGIPALGIDVSPAAVRLARSEGISVLEGSVFDRVPGEGEWQTALLVDGNIGIGGDVSALLARCVQLITPDGEIVVEVSADPLQHRTYTATVVDDRGGESAAFPWAEVGTLHLERIARLAGLAPRASWQLGGRHFCRLAASR
ncbi:class I SAM-dependent methyltransferase [soil metagenome]